MSNRALRSNFIPFFAFFFFLSGVVCNIGCRSVNATVEMQQNPVVNLSKYKIIVIDVSSKDPDFNSTEIDQLTDSIVSGLRNSARFEKVYAASSKIEHDADLKLSVTVQLAISPTLNGTQSLESSAVLTDASDGKKLAEATVKSGTGAGLFGVKTSTVIARLGDQIVDFVEKL
jgi:hypothetical protein